MIRDPLLLLKSCRDEQDGDKPLGEAVCDQRRWDGHQRVRGGASRSQNDGHGHPDDGAGSELATHVCSVLYNTSPLLSYRWEMVQTLSWCCLEPSSQTPRSSSRWDFPPQRLPRDTRWHARKLLQSCQVRRGLDKLDAYFFKKMPRKLDTSSKFAMKKQNLTSLLHALPACHIFLVQTDQSNASNRAMRIYFFSCRFGVSYGE